MSFPAAWMDLKVIILSEVSQTEKDISYDISYMQNLKKNTTNALIYKTETDFKKKQTYGYQMKTWQGRTNKDLGINKDTSLYIKYIINKDLL